MRNVISSVLLVSTTLASVAHAQAPAAAADAPASTAPAAAPTPEVLKESADHYQRGLSLYGEGEFVLALVEFERAYQLTPNYRVLYNIGQVRIQLGRYAKGREALEEYLKQGGDSINAERTTAVKKDLEMLAERTAVLSVVVSEPGADVAVDGRVVGVSPLAAPLVIDAGEHTLDVRKGGFYDKSSQVTLAGRDQIEVKLDLLKIPEAQASRVIVEQHTDKPQATKTARTAAYVGWAATGTFAVTAGVFGYLGIKKANDLESMRTNFGVTTSQLDSTKSSASNLLLAADIAGGVAAIAGGVSLYLTLSSREHSAQPSAPKPGTVSSLGLGFSPQGVRLNGEF
jgi:tetratricopeptide (TPR) repeat protein